MTQRSFELASQIMQIHDYVLAMPASNIPHLATGRPRTRASDPSAAAVESWLDGRTDAELLRDVDFPAQSFAVFYRRHVAALIRFAAGRGVDAETAADVASDTFFAALRGRTRYRPEHDTARLWLLGIAARRLADVHRRRQTDARKEERLRTEAVVLTQADRDSYERLLANSERAALDALGDLPESQRRAIRARVLEHRDYADVASALGLSEPAARQHVSRGLAALRRNLGRPR